MGMAGAAVIWSAYGGGSVQGMSVTEATYGREDEDDHPKNIKPVPSTTIAGLRLTKSPSIGDAYYITDPDQEGFFVYDSGDTVSADNTGTILVSTDGARFKRIVDNYSVNAKWYGAKGDGIADDTLSVQAALNEALRWPNVNVNVPSGTYRMTSELYVFKNTFLKMDETTVLLRSHDGNVIRNYRTSDVFYNYEGNGNITIEGGVLDCNGVKFTRVCNGMALAHAENITLRKLTIKDTQSGHGVELTGVRHVMIDQCRFVGFMFTTQNYSEAIQLEPALKAGFVGQVADHTPTHHVTVQHCYFGPSGTPGTVPWPCGVGAHGAYPDAYFEHIIVSDNVMENSTYWAIRPFKWLNSVISGNHLKKVNGGFFVSTPAATSASSKDDNGVFHPVQPASTLIIENNIISTGTNNGIYVEGFPEGSGEKVIIANNIFKNVDGNSISLRCANCVVTGNILDGAKKNGIFITESSNVIVSDNLIRDVNLHGIQINNSKRVIVNNNSITNASQNGDNTNDGISLTGNGAENRIIGNVVRTEAGKKKVRYGLNAVATITLLTRLQNDLRCEAATANLKDLSVTPNTSFQDLE
jgi:parallel beta-helix repeat protein